MKRDAIQFVRSIYRANKASAIFLFGLGLSGLLTQEAIGASGGTTTRRGGTTNYTVGQIVYTTNTGTTDSVAQGVQQAYEISVVSGIEQTKGINLKCSAYPNPVTYFLNLNVENYDTENLSYQLFDISGKVLGNKILTSNETRIDMNKRVPSIYFLKVMVNQIEVKTFKIIKN